ncbi:hypothetical protein BLNAU_19829 [Blattamonas nauphoetae]|uniref:Uncharacterized protein n=1 Tax=Blattamonas nauphoetae TaxID=2049346 RepID=A0ABQ9X107_9EUKA|nr:hypothetical protein BLNAU_19829 [Blattamonas nauphoetae]
MIVSKDDHSSRSWIPQKPSTSVVTFRPHPRTSFKMPSPTPNNPNYPSALPSPIPSAIPQTPHSHVSSLQSLPNYMPISENNFANSYATITVPYEEQLRQLSSIIDDNSSHLSATNASSASSFNLPQKQDTNIDATQLQLQSMIDELNFLVGGRIPPDIENSPLHSILAPNPKQTQQTHRLPRRLGSASSARSSQRGQIFTTGDSTRSWSTGRPPQARKKFMGKMDKKIAALCEEVSEKNRRQAPNSTLASIRLFEKTGMTASDDSITTMEKLLHVNQEKQKAGEDVYALTSRQHPRQRSKRQNASTRSWSADRVPKMTARRGLQTDTLADISVFLTEPQYSERQPLNTEHTSPRSSQHKSIPRLPLPLPRPPQTAPSSDRGRRFLVHHLNRHKQIRDKNADAHQHSLQTRIDSGERQAVERVPSIHSPSALRFVPSSNPAVVFRAQIPTGMSRPAAIRGFSCDLPIVANRPRYEVSKMAVLVRAVVVLFVLNDSFAEFRAKKRIGRAVRRAEGQVALNNWQSVQRERNHVIGAAANSIVSLIGPLVLRERLKQRKEFTTLLHSMLTTIRVQLKFPLVVIPFRAKLIAGQSMMKSFVITTSARLLGLDTLWLEAEEEILTGRSTPRRRPPLTRSPTDKAFFDSTAMLTNPHGMAFIRKDMLSALCQPDILHQRRGIVMRLQHLSHRRFHPATPRKQTATVPSARSVVTSVNSPTLSQTQSPHRKQHLATPPFEYHSQIKAFFRHQFLRTKLAQTRSWYYSQAEVVEHIDQFGYPFFPLFTIASLVMTEWVLEGLSQWCDQMENSDE